MRTIFSSALIFMAVVLVASTWAYKVSLQNGLRWTCDIIHEAYFRKSHDLDLWQTECRNLTGEVDLATSKRKAIDLLNSKLDEVKVSHLGIYSPEKNNEMWDNTAVDNGLRVRVIDGASVVSSVVPESSADNSGFKVGDELIRINGEAPLSAYEIRFQSGKFDLKRLENGKDTEYEADLRAEELQEDLQPTFIKVSGDTGVLRLASFLPQYFEERRWRETVSEFSKAKNIIVDLRDNSGGNFVAMLRGLSPFFCKATPVGIISSDAEEGKQLTRPKKNLADDLEARIQIDQIEKEPSLTLSTYDNYGCSNARVTVLVDANTASTAEIFAYAMSGRPNTRVWGVPTAGEVVVARWYDLSQIGFTGYSLSIPIAGFFTTAGTELESEGITPAKLLFYSLEEARAGKDSWLELSLK